MFSDKAIPLPSSPAASDLNLPTLIPQFGGVLVPWVSLLNLGVEIFVIFPFCLYVVGTRVAMKSYCFFLIQLQRH